MISPIFTTLPPLSLTAAMFGCCDSLMINSAVMSMPVFAGKLYTLTGIGEASARRV